MTPNQQNNKIQGDNAGRDLTKNYFYSSLSLDQLFKRITTSVRELLPNKLFNFKLNSVVEFEAESLFDSLVQIAIPAKVVIEILEKLPQRVKIEEDLNNFSTRDLRRVIYRSLQNLDYVKFGEKVDIWGEHYIRKFGNPDVEIQVILDEENRVKPLNYDFLYDKLIPEIYYKCYHRDIDEDLKFIQARFLKQEIASEIMEKVRILNLYQIRYSTLKKLSFDMAIQPPHPWFTNRLNTDEHIYYHKKKYEKHFEKFQKKDNVARAAQEFVEHCCAAILAKYNLFIGLGKYRPLINLSNYLKLNNFKNGNILYWQQLEISNLPGDLFLAEINFHKFKSILETILIRIREAEEHYKELHKLFSTLIINTNKLIKRRERLFKISTEAESPENLQKIILELFGYYDKMVVYEFRMKFSFIEYVRIEGMEAYLNMAFFTFDRNNGIRSLLPNDLGRNSNSIVAFTNQDIPNYKIRNIINEKFPDVEIIFCVKQEEFYVNTIAPSRRINFEKLLKEKEI